MIEVDNTFNRRRTYLEDGAQLIFWVRFAAFLVDYILLLMTKNFLLFIIGLFGDFSFRNYAFFFEVKVLISIPVLIIYFLSASIFESSRLQATPAKYFFRLKVCKKDGSKLLLSLSLFRNVVKIISLGSLIGAWIINLTNKRQALHDLAVGSIVKRR